MAQRHTDVLAELTDYFRLRGRTGAMRLGMEQQRCRLSAAELA